MTGPSVDRAPGVERDRQTRNTTPGVTRGDRHRIERIGHPRRTSVAHKPRDRAPGVSLASSTPRPSTRFSVATPAARRLTPRSRGRSGGCFRVSARHMCWWACASCVKAGARRRPDDVIAPDETQSSAQRPNSRLLSAEGHCVRTLNTCANSRTRSLRQAPRCDRARAAQQGAYGHKAGV